MISDYVTPAEVDEMIEAVQVQVAAPHYEDGYGGGGRIVLDVAAGTITHASYYYELVTEDQADEEL